MKIKLKTKLLFVFTSFLSIIMSAINVFIAIMLQRSVDYAGSGNLNGLIQTLLIALLVILPFELIVSVLAVRLRLGFIRDIIISVKRNRLSFLFSRSTSKTQVNDEDELSFFTTDTDILALKYYSSIAKLTLYISSFIFALVALIWISWIVTLTAIAISIFPLLCNNFFSNALSKRKKDYSDATARYVGVVKECIQGKKDITAYGKENLFLTRHDNENKILESKRLSDMLLNSIAYYVSSALGLLVQIVVLGLSSYFVITGDLSFGFMIAIVQLMNNVLNPINNLVTSINSIKSAKEILIKSKCQPAKIIDKNDIHEFNDSIVISNLCLSYAGDNNIINNLSLSFKKGHKYAITAPSGYGKTSIAKVLAMEIHDFNGDVLIDSKNISNIDYKQYTNLVRFVRQDPFLFTDTILNNILFFTETKNEKQVEHVINICKIDEFMTDDKALKRVVSNNDGLSGGQKQRIVLARALMHNPQVLILDEPTSGIDIKTSIEILSALFKNKSLTCIVITHETDKRFLSLFDKVIRLDNRDTVKVYE